MTRVLLIAPRDSYRIVPYLNAAKELGVNCLIASNGKNSLIPAVAEGITIDLSDPESATSEILRAIDDLPLDGVIPTDDATVELTFEIARRLGLPGNDPQAARYARRKDLARARLRECGVSVPDHQTMPLEPAMKGMEPGLSFPVVVKPLSLSGSRGVIRADNGEQFRAAVERIKGLVQAHPEQETREQCLIEAFVPGDEVALEGLMDEGRLQVLTLFDKPDPLDGPYFEETYYVMPSRHAPSIQERCAQVVQAACDAYGLSTGPVHAELRVDGDDVVVVEVAARTIGGQCARLLRMGTGQGVEMLVMRQALGHALELKPMEDAAGVLMLPTPCAGALRRVEGVSKAMAVPGVEEVEISLREGAELIPVPEGESYLGFVFARGESSEIVEAALRQAQAHLNVVVGPLFKIKPRDQVSQSCE